MSTKVYTATLKVAQVTDSIKLFNFAKPHVISWIHGNTIYFQVVVFDLNLATRDPLDYFESSHVKEEPGSYFTLEMKERHPNPDKLSMVVIDGHFKPNREPGSDTKLDFRYPQTANHGKGQITTPRGTISVPKKIGDIQSSI